MNWLFEKWTRLFSVADPGYGGPQLSRQNQKPHGKNKAILFLPWGFWFGREVFCFCRAVFGFAVRYFVFAVRFSVLPWDILFLPWSFWFCRASCGPPYRGGSRALLLVRPNWAPKGRKKIFFGDRPPAYLRDWMAAPPPTPSYLKVCIRHWICRFSNL